MWDGDVCWRRSLVVGMLEQQLLRGSNSEVVDIIKVSRAQVP